MLYRYRSRRYTELTISYSELFKKGKQIKQNRNNNHAQWHPIHKYNTSHIFAYIMLSNSTISVNFFVILLLKQYKILLKHIHCLL